MTPETFFANFALFADAPDAVAKLRELVLELAVQGRLSAPLRADDPVPPETEFRENAAALASSLGLRSPKESLEETEPPFNIPEHWRWMALADVGAAQTGTTPSKADHDAFNGDIPFIKPADILPGSVNYSNESLTRHGAESGSRLAPCGSLLMVCIGTIGKCNLIERECAFNQQINSLTPVAAVDSRYLLGTARSRSFQDAAWKKSSSTTIAILNKGKWLSIPVPIPPLAEQKRIVAKVDELMALCDRLEAQQQEREEQGRALARAALARFADAPTPANLQWIFHSTFPIPPADLRKSILTLAVQGKLVPQDPNDEPAEDCLTRIGIKNTLPPDEADDSLPSLWSRVRFEDIALTAGGVTLGRKLGDRKTVTLPYLRVANVKRGEIDLGVIKEVTIGEDEVERYALRENDLLMTEGGDWDKVGRAAIWKGQIAICLHQNHVFRSRMRSTEISPVWFERYFNSPDGRRYFESASKQTTNLASINMRQVRGCPVPLPPLAEQRRIVAKVDELMALVDALETQLATDRTTATALLAAALAELTTA